MKRNIFICGHKDHKCDSKGKPVYLLWEDPYEVPKNTQSLLDYGDKISGESVTCSICGKSAASTALWDLQ